MGCWLFGWLVSWLFLVGYLIVFCLIVGLLGWSVGSFVRSFVRRWRLSALFNVAAPSATVTSASSKIIQKLFTGIKDKIVKCYA